MALPLLASTDIAMALDPALMARRAGLILDPWQTALVRSQALRTLVNCSRQTGKSTTTGVLADHVALYEPDSTILLLSPSQRQSGELFRKCMDVYNALGRPVAATAESALHVELENRSRIVSLPGKEDTVRGISKVRLLIIDEASRVSDELYKAVRPMLAVSGGQLVNLSTPNGTRGFFYEAYLHRDQWDYYEVPATECPRITAEFLAEELANMGLYWYEQEYCCKFNDAELAAFRTQDIMRIVGKEVQTWAL